MTENFGERIKKLAIVLFFSEAFFFILCEALLIKCLEGEHFILLSLSFFAALFIWITNFLLYAFGELVEKIIKTEKALSEISAKILSSSQ